MARIIGEVRPQYVFVENSPMLVTRGLDVVLADLAALGFDARWGVVSAADVGANHKRERIWIKAKQRHFLPHSMQHGDGRRQQQSQGTQETIGMANSKHFGGISTQEVGSDHGVQQQVSPRSQLCVNEPTGAGCVRQDADMADTDCERGCLRETNREDAEDVGQLSRGATRPGWWEIEPNVGRVADGVAARVDRLKALGNGQVPLCAATAWGLLK